MTSKRERVHGMSRTPMYRLWSHVLERCYRPNHIHFKNYGGRGIKVCDRWRESFEAFLADMGEKPSPEHSLDRIDTNGDYSPENCRWATRTEQSRNRRCSHSVTFNGVTKPASEWAKDIGITTQSLLYRIKAGWPLADALTSRRKQPLRLSREELESLLAEHKAWTKVAAHLGVSLQPIVTARQRAGLL